MATFIAATSTMICSFQNEISYALAAAKQASRWQVAAHSATACSHVGLCVKLQTPSKRRKDSRTVRQSVRLSLSPLYLPGASICEQTAMLRGNFIGGGGKNPGSTNKYTKFGQLVIRKIAKIIATRMSHCQATMHQILFPASVRPSVF